MSKLIVNEIEKYDAGQLTITTGTNVSIGSDLTVGGALAGTLSTAAQPNVTSVGTLSSLTVSGGITGDVLGDVTGDLTGDVLTAAQTNITSVGTLSSLAVSGDLTVDTDTLKVDSANNRVGIGTASPSYKLSVYSQGDYNTIQNLLNISAKDTSGGTYSAGTGSGLSFSSSHWSVSSTEKVMGAIYGANESTNSGADGYLTFHTRSSDSVAEHMRITSSGNVGIGTSSITSYGFAYTNLDIANTAGAYITLKGTQTPVTLDIAADGTSGFLGTKTAHPLIIRTSDAERMRITSGGSVLIGTTTSTASADGVLKVAGAVILSKQVTVADDEYVDLQISNSNLAYWTGFLGVTNSDASNGSSRTQTNFSIICNNQFESFSTSSLHTADGAAAGRSFTVTYVDDGIIRITNTSGNTCVLSAFFYGGGAGVV
jgi:hypothetical protein